jgi:hypothetical protein
VKGVFCLLLLSCRSCTPYGMMPLCATGGRLVPRTKRGPGFIHIHRLGPGSLQQDRARPKTGPDRCICISSGPALSFIVVCTEGRRSSTGYDRSAEHRVERDLVGAPKSSIFDSSGP